PVVFMELYLCDGDSTMLTAPRRVCKATRLALPFRFEIVSRNPKSEIRKPKWKGSKHPVTTIEDRCFGFRISDLGLQSLYHEFQEFACPLRQGVDLLRRRRPLDQRREDVLATERHGPAGEGDRLEEPVVVDFTQARPAVLVRRGEVAVVLDAETAHLVGAL